MIQIEFNQETCKYTESLKLISISEKNVKFGTVYRIWNPLTNFGKVFNFSHSTGPEFAADTKFIYKSDDGFTLEVLNDEELTKKRSNMYLESKTN